MEHTSSGFSSYERQEKMPQKIASSAVNDAREGFSEEPEFAFVFASPQVDMERLASAIDAELDCEWVGCSTANEICDEGQLDGSCVVLLIASEDIELESVVVDGIHSDPDGKAADVAAELGEADAFIPLVPGFTQETPTVDFKVLKGILSEKGSDVPVVGAAAGDEHQYAENFQFRNGNVYTDALVLTALRTEKEIDMGLDHGFQPTDNVYMPTVEGNRVTKLNGRPAQEVYAEHIGVAPEELEGVTEAPTGAVIPKLIAKYAHKHPFGVPIGDDHVLKVPETVTEDGAIVFSCEIPENTQLVLMERGEEDLSATVKNSMYDWVEEDRDVAFALVFECAGRDLALQEDELEEVEALQNAINGPFAGFFSYGEIGGLEKDMCTANFFTVTSLVVYDD